MGRLPQPEFALLFAVPVRCRIVCKLWEVVIVNVFVAVRVALESLSSCFVWVAAKKSYLPRVFLCQFNYNFIGMIFSVLLFLVALGEMQIVIKCLWFTCKVKILYCI